LGSVFILFWGEKMKFILLFIGVILLPSVAYAQYLESSDLDIFIENSDLVLKTLGKYMVNGGDSNWKEYHFTFATIYGTILQADFYFYDDQRFEESINDMKENYLKLINYTGPDELRDVFELIGWGNNGNKKFCTIFFGFKLLMHKMEISFFSKIENEISEAGIEISEAAKASNEYIMMERYYKNSSRALIIINDNDLELIESRFSELTEKIR
jgi:hypothetical protein